MFKYCISPKAKNYWGEGGIHNLWQYLVLKVLGWLPMLDLVEGRGAGGQIADVLEARAYSGDEVSAGRDDIGVVGIEDSRGAGSTALCQ